MVNWLPTEHGSTLHCLPDGADRTLCGTMQKSLDFSPDPDAFDLAEDKCRQCQKSRNRIRRAFGSDPELTPDDVDFGLKDI